MNPKSKTTEERNLSSFLLGRFQSCVFYTERGGTMCEKEPPGEVALKISGMALGKLLSWSPSFLTWNTGMML